MRDVAVGKTAADINTGRRGRAIVKGGHGTARRTLGVLGGIYRSLSRKASFPSVLREASSVRPTAAVLSVSRGPNIGHLEMLYERRSINGENRMPILAIRLLALTGCRRGEIERLQWAEIDLEACCLRLSDTKEGMSVRPIGKAARELLRQALACAVGKYVLLGRSADEHFKGLPKAWLRIVKSCAIYPYASRASSRICVSGLRSRIY